MDQRGPGTAELLHHAVVSAAVPCRTCGYLLKGLRGDGRCPECGLAIPETLRAIVDPESSRLPQLADPRRVARGLLWLHGCAVVAVILLLGAGVAGGTGVRWGSLRPGVDPIAAASAVMLAALWSLHALRPRRGGAPSTSVWRDIRLLGLGLVGWSVAAFCLWWRRRELAMLGGATPGVDGVTAWTVLGLAGASAAGLLGVAGIMNTIGRRSRAYRQSHSGRQGGQAMIAAVAGVAAGAAAQLVLARVAPRSYLGLTVAATVLRVSSFMAAVGLLYMLLNAWWIRTALRRPPPALEQLVLPDLPADARVPDEPSDDEPR